METKELPEKGKNSLFDLAGSTTGLKMTRGRTISLLLAIAVFVICSLLPLDSIHPLAGKGLGLVFAVIILWVSAQFNLVYGAFILAFGSVFLGFQSLNEMLTTFGTSNFISLLGMLILAMGATETNFARRVAFFFLSKWGKKPVWIVVAIATATTIISAFCSNLATIILMSSIAVGILDGLGAEKLVNKFAKGLMICIPVFASLGGMALVSGSPAMNMVGLTALETASEGAHTITYAQWAVVGVISAIILLVPIIFVFLKLFKINNKSSAEVDTDEFNRKLADLGPMSGSEIRWVVTTLAFVIIMLTGKMNLKVNALLFAIITISPVIGTVKAETALKSLPLNVLFLNGFAGIISVIFATTNITGVLQNGVSGLVGELPVFWLMLVCCLILTFLNNIFPNATAGIIALCISAMTPIVMGLGYNPSVVLMPAIFIGSYNIVLGMQDVNTLNYGYGYWKMNDTILPNTIVIVTVAVVVSIVSYFVCPMLGMSYLL